MKSNSTITLLGITIGPRSRKGGKPHTRSCVKYIGSLARGKQLSRFPSRFFLTRPPLVGASSDLLLQPSQRTENADSNELECLDEWHASSACADRLVGPRRV